MRLKPSFKKQFLRGSISLLCLMPLTLSTSVPVAYASQGKQLSLKEIKIEGAQRIEPETVRSYLKIKPGDLITEEQINDSLKSLYASGFFTNVQIEQAGNTLLVKVSENPIINRIAYEGNEKVSDEILETESELKPRTIFTRAKVQKDVERLLAIYRFKGRFAAKVTPKIIELPQNRVDLVYEIDEGPTTRIRRIAFIGNKSFTESDLESAISTKESRWYRFFSSDDIYDPDKLAYDQDLLRKFYLDHGYADFHIVSAVAELTPDQQDFFITFTIEEGERYKYGEVSLDNHLPHIDESSLKDALKVKTGDWYSTRTIDQTIEALTNKIGNFGYAFIDIKPQPKRNPETNTVDLTFVIKEGPKVFINRIDIVGNTVTADEVIRREFTLAEGDAFNSNKLQQSERNIKNLGFFKNVTVAKLPGDTPDTMNLKTEVEEQSTGEMLFGLGYSTLDGPLAEIAVNQRNLMGRGYDSYIKTTFAKRKKSYSVGFSDPYFLGKRLAAGIDLNYSTLNLEDESSFKQRSIGGDVWFGYMLGEDLFQKVTYGISQDQIRGIKANASRFVRAQQGTSTSSYVGQTLTYDKRDYRLDPTSGYFVSLSNTYAGLGGNVKYLRNELSAGQYFSLTETLTLALKGRTGIIFGLGRTTRIIDRFALGGESLRGFDYSGIGPRDISVGTHDALNGMKYYALTMEAKFPIGLPNEFGVKGRTFIDAGSVWDAQTSDPVVYNSKSIRATVGAGLSWASPLGPLRIDIATPFKKEKYDKTRLFLFSIGHNF